jgi:heme o synthase
MEHPALEASEQLAGGAEALGWQTGEWVADLVSLTKPRLSSLVLCTLAGGMWLAPGALPVSKWLGTLLGTALLVGGANALNCWAERDRDRLMARTRSRPLAAGRMPPDVGLGFGVLLASAAVPMLALASNVLTLALGLLALLSYVAAYTPMKSRTAWALMLGTLPGALPPLMGWTAVTGKLDAGGLLLFALLVTWQVPHFLAIAVYRRNDYRAAGIRVFPLVYGEAATRVFMAISAFLLVVVSLLLIPFGFGGLLYSSVAALLGVAFLMLVLWGACLDGGRAWAGKVFRLSVIHLTLLFVALLISAAPHRRIAPASGSESMVARTLH